MTPTVPGNCSVLPFEANYSPFTSSFKNTIVLFAFSEDYSAASTPFSISDYL